MRAYIQLTYARGAADAHETDTIRPYHVLAVAIIKYMGWQQKARARPSDKGELICKYARLHT